MLPVIALGLALLSSQATAPPPAADSSGAPSAQSSPSATRIDKDSIIMAPKVLYQVEPQFTKDASKVRLAGVATVALIVDTEGNPTNVHIIHSIADSLDQKHRDKKHIAAALTFDQAAVEAVEKYKFVPATKAGRPVAVELNVEVNFQIF